MKKVIVSGANGFIGTALLKVLNEAAVQVYAIVKNENENENIDAIKHLGNVRIIYCDMEHISNLPDLIPDNDVDVCIHLAWAGSFGEGRANYELQLTNVNWTLKLVEAIALMGVKRFVGAGTLAEKDVMSYHPTDGATPNAVSMYGIAKMTAHFMTKTECTKKGIEHIWCYLSNTYGVGNTTDNFVNMASVKMLKGEHAAFTAGEQIYDFVYVTDTARAIYAAADQGKNNTAYYLGSASQRKLKEYVTTIRDAIDSSIELFLGEIPFNGISLTEDAYDTQKLIKDTGYQPEICFEDGIKRTIEWLREDMV